MNSKANLLAVYPELVVSKIPSNAVPDKAMYVFHIPNPFTLLFALEFENIMGYEVERRFWDAAWLQLQNMMIAKLES